MLLAVGPGAGGLLAQCQARPHAERPALWVATELPFHAERIPADFLAQVRNSSGLFVWEEHVANGGAGQMLSLLLMRMGVYPARFEHFHAKGYLSGRYGSQSFHRIESGLDPAFVLASITKQAAI